MEDWHFIEGPIDEIDASIFTGDIFLRSEEARKKFREIMARWERGLKEHEETAVEIEKERIADIMENGSQAERLP